MPVPRIPAPLRRPRSAIALLALSGAAALSLAPAQASDPLTRISGHALLAPSGNAGATVASGPEGRRAAVLQDLVQPGLTIGRVRVALETRSGGPVAQARGTVSARDVVLLDGRVSLTALDMAVTASAGPDSPAAGITRGQARGLRIDGEPVTARAGARIAVPGAGTLVFFEQSASGGDVRANALRLEPSAGGAALVVGHLDASAAAGEDAPRVPPVATAPAVPPVAPQEPRGPALVPQVPRAESPPPAPPPVAPLPRRHAPAVAVQGAGYVFPVFGEASFTDDWGAPRAGTGTHHGNDIFAPTGTPVLAVADGTLSRVGVNPLGGNRLWLTDDRGNRFYYAHLSAYAPSAADGARVAAGQVIAFVGNTGQAITTPPHLHFEIHPAGGDAVNPYRFLTAWQRAEAAPVAAPVEALRAPASTGTPPGGGAVVVGVTPERDVAPPQPAGVAVPVG